MIIASKNLISISHLRYKNKENIRAHMRTIHVQGKHRKIKNKITFILLKYGYFFRFIKDLKHVRFVVKCQPT